MSNTNSTDSKPVLSNGSYNILKFIALVLLPALGTLYFAVATIWDIPGAEKVVGTIVAIDTFLGVLLGLSSSNYKKNVANGDIESDGTLVIDTSNPMKDTYSFEVATPLSDVAEKRSVTLKVQNNSASE